MRALLQGLRVFGQLAPDDAAVPFGVVDVLAGRLVLVRALGGEREGGEVRVGGGDGGGVFAKESMSASMSSLLICATTRRSLA
jgi:hypothetical protein